MTFAERIMNRRFDLLATSFGDVTNEDDTPVYDDIVLNWENIREAHSEAWRRGYNRAFNGFDGQVSEWDNEHWVDGYKAGDRDYAEYEMLRDFEDEQMGGYWN